MPKGFAVKNKRFYGYDKFGYVQPHPAQDLVDTEGEQHFPTTGKNQEQRTCVIHEKDILFVNEEHPAMGWILREGVR